MKEYAKGIVESLKDPDSFWNSHHCNPIFSDVYHLPRKKVRKLLALLEDSFDGKYFFVVTEHSDGSYGVYQQNYWNKGEHKDGHVDRLILSGMF